MRCYQRRLAALHVIGALLLTCIPIFAQDLPVDTIQKKSIHMAGIVEESKITIKDSWAPPCPGSVRRGDEAYRTPPVAVLPTGWLAYVSQGVMGSWIGSCKALAFQTIDRA